MKKKLYVSAATAREYSLLTDDPEVRESFLHVAEQFDRAASGVDPSPDKSTLSGGRK